MLQNIKHNCLFHITTDLILQMNGYNSSENASYASGRSHMPNEAGELSNSVRTARGSTGIENNSDNTIEDVSSTSLENGNNYELKHIFFQLMMVFLSLLWITLSFITIYKNKLVIKLIRELAKSIYLILGVCLIYHKYREDIYNIKRIFTRNHNNSEESPIKITLIIFSSIIIMCSMAVIIISFVMLKNDSQSLKVSK